MLTVVSSIEMKVWAAVIHVLDEEEGAGLHLKEGEGGGGGINLSLTYTKMVHLLPRSCLLSGSEGHDLQKLLQYVDKPHTCCRDTAFHRCLYCFDIQFMSSFIKVCIYNTVA